MKAAEWIILSGGVFYILTMLALIDIYRKDFGGIEKKGIWALVCMIPFLGVIVYIAFGFPKGKRPNSNDGANGKGASD